MHRAALALLLAAAACSPAPQPAAKKIVHAAAAAGTGRKALPGPSAFAIEQTMSHAQLMARWKPLIGQASKRFGVPESWLRAVMQAESGGRTMLAENKPIVSDAGAMGLMQLMPQTWREMRSLYGLGSDPFDPHDNVFAGAAYLRWLRGKYGYPTMFAAYNDGPGNLEERLKSGGLLPKETQLYLVDVTAGIEGRTGAARGNAQFTRPNGAPVLIDCSQVTKVRAPLPDEYAATVQAVVTIGKVRQGVREDVAKVTAIVRAHGGAI
jgi:soluble lytic murein transglycosylase-like protein